MDLKEIKKLIKFARQNGVKSLTVDGFHFELHETAVLSPRVRRLRMPSGKVQDHVVPAPDPGPTLDDINQFIYAPTEESA